MSLIYVQPKPIQLNPFTNCMKYIVIAIYNNKQTIVVQHSKTITLIKRAREYNLTK